MSGNYSCQLYFITVGSSLVLWVMRMLLEARNACFSFSYLKVSFLLHKIMKKIYTLIFTLAAFKIASITSGNCYAQNMETYKLDKIVPMAPEGAKFANYFFTPSVSATGSVPIEIPLYELNIDGVKIPITLSYQTSGIRVTELSGSVGLGWSLNAGGGVYRSINGQPDDNQSDNPSTSTFLDPTISMSNYMVDKVNLKYLETIYQPFAQLQSELASLASNNGYDMNQDNYTYNFLNRNGGLFFNSQLELKQLSDNKLIFTHDSKYLNYFLAKDDEGNNYKFGTREKGSNSYYSSASSNTSMSGYVYGTTAWKLSEITTVHNKTINFSYIDYTTSYNYPSSNMLYNISGLQSEDPNSMMPCFNDKTQFSTSFANIQNTNKLITSISADDATILFSYSDDPNASNWKRKLDKIEVQNYKGEIIKVIRFEYSVFNGDPRLKLTKLIFDAVNGSEHSDYSFLYNEHMNMPQVNTMSKDGFGFYNGYNNTTLLKARPPIVNGIADSYHNSHREVVETYTTVGSLSQIIYPTSGALKLYYGANRYGTSFAPGLRVDKLEFLDNGGNVVNTKFYEYGDIQGLKINFPDYAKRNWPVDINLNFSSHCFSYSSEDTQQQRHLPANFFYQTVAIKEVGNGQEMTTVEHYSDPNLYQTNEPLEGYVFQPILHKRDFYKGNNINGQIVKSESFWYDQIVSQTDSANVYEALPAYYMNAFFSDATYPCFSYNPGLIVKQIIRAKRLKLDSQTDEYFFADGSSNFSNTTYHYDNPSHTYPTRVINNTSNGAPTLKKIKYPLDMVQSSSDPLGVYQLMCALNIISSPINSTTEVQDKINGVMNEYSHSTYGFPVLSTVKSLNVLSQQYEGRIRHNIYNQNGQVLEEQNENGPKVCYLWGYNSQYPVAKVVNSSYAAVNAVVTQSQIDAATSIADNDQAVRSLLNTIRSSITDAQIWTYTYSPLIGMTSETDAKGMTTYYEYDAFQRLKCIKDQTGNIINSYDYHYKP